MLYIHVSVNEKTFILLTIFAAVGMARTRNATRHEAYSDGWIEGKWGLRIVNKGTLTLRSIDMQDDKEVEYDKLTEIRAGLQRYTDFKLGRTVFMIETSGSRLGISKTMLHIYPNRKSYIDEVAKPMVPPKKKRWLSSKPFFKNGGRSTITLNVNSLHTGRVFPSWSRWLPKWFNDKHTSLELGFSPVGKGQISRWRSAPAKLPALVEGSAHRSYLTSTIAKVQEYKEIVGIPMGGYGAEAEIEFIKELFMKRQYSAKGPKRPPTLKVKAVYPIHSPKVQKIWRAPKDTKASKTVPEYHYHIHGRSYNAGFPEPFVDVYNLQSDKTGWNMGSAVQLLFHGSTADVIDSISLSGFKPAPPAGNMMGGGVYFAPDPQKASQYPKGWGPSVGVTGKDGTLLAKQMIVSLVNIEGPYVTAGKTSDGASAAYAHNPDFQEFAVNWKDDSKPMAIPLYVISYVRA